MPPRRSKPKKKPAPRRPRRATPPHRTPVGKRSRSALRPTVGRRGGRSSPREHRITFAFSGKGLDYFLLKLVNRLLATATFGLYSAWGKAKSYEYMYGHTEVAGEPLRFHGTGWEIFKGYILIFFVILGCYLMAAAGGFAGFGLASLAGHWAASVLAGALFFLFILAILTWLFEGGYFRSRRYRAARLSLYGVRFSVAGRAWPFVKRMYGQRLLTLASLGLWLPYYHLERDQAVFGALRWGQHRFSYAPDRRAWWRLFMRGLLLSLLTLGIYAFWWVPDLKRFFFANLRLGKSRFELELTPTDYAELVLSNFFLVIFTLGLGWAWAQTRAAAFWCARLQLRGPLDLRTALQQAQAREGAGGEAVEEQFDLDLDWGF